MQKHISRWLVHYVGKHKDKQRNKIIGQAELFQQRWH